MSTEQTSTMTEVKSQATLLTAPTLEDISESETDFPFYLEQEADYEARSQSFSSIPFEIFQSSSSSVTCESELHDSTTFCMQFVVEPKGSALEGVPLMQEFSQVSESIKTSEGDEERRNSRSKSPGSKKGRSQSDRQSPTPRLAKPSTIARRAVSMGTKPSPPKDLEAPFRRTTSNGSRSKPSPRRNLTADELPSKPKKRPIRRSKTTGEEGDEVPFRKTRPERRSNTSAKGEERKTGRRVPRSERTGARKAAKNADEVVASTTPRDLSPLGLSRSQTSMESSGKERASHGRRRANPRVLDESLTTTTSSSSTRVRIQRSEMKRSSTSSGVRVKRSATLDSSASEERRRERAACRRMRSSDSSLPSGSETTANEEHHLSPNPARRQRSRRHLSLSPASAHEVRVRSSGRRDVLRTQLSQTVHNTTILEEKSKELTSGSFSPAEDEKLDESVSEQEEPLALPDLSSATEHSKASLTNAFTLKGMVNAAKSTIKSTRSSLYLPTMSLDITMRKTTVTPEQA